MFKRAAGFVGFMHLKQYLKKQLSDSLVMLKTCVAQTEEAQRVLEELSMKQATYVVHIHSHWVTMGEVSTETEHAGSLEQAIQKAEHMFKSINKRSDIQASYFVEITLGERGFGVPEQYWRQYVNSS